MRAMVHAKVSRNMEYHQQMAEHYAGQAEAARSSRSGDDTVSAHTAEEEAAYLADLHADVAQQLADVLGTGEPPAIIGAVPPVSRTGTTAPLAVAPPVRVRPGRGTTRRNAVN